jgi:hypothetical protein
MNLGENNETSNSVNDDEAEEPEPTIAAPLPPVGQVRIVRKLTRDQFRSRLVDHFDILFHKNKIQWPRRVTEKQPTMPTLNNRA